MTGSTFQLIEHTLGQRHFIIHESFNLFHMNSKRREYAALENHLKMTAHIWNNNDRKVLKTSIQDCYGQCIIVKAWSIAFLFAKPSIARSASYFTYIRSKYIKTDCWIENGDVVPAPFQNVFLNSKIAWLFPAFRNRKIWTCCIWYNLNWHVIPPRLGARPPFISYLIQSRPLSTRYAEQLTKEISLIFLFTIWNRDRYTVIFAILASAGWT